ncbi:sugar phosphate exchanger 3-like isoform X2 [Tubulanus polymorphus]|uniref:sugar phosphate exchanger 3-like isoform X2 n=1 Tax=Tubulanus polymorphus TaxID=672921 RepID=UPI003DA20997
MEVEQEENEQNIRRRQKTKKKSLTWTHHHVAVFVLTFSSYAFFHATRKTFSNVKATLSQEWTPSENNLTQNQSRTDDIWNKHHLFKSDEDAELYLGTLDSIFMISYAVGLYISGFLGDRLNLRILLSGGMCLSAIVVFVFGCLMEWVGPYYNMYVYGVLWSLNGLVQSTGWPCVVTCMGNWFGKSSRGFVLGAWSACASVGNIIGALEVTEVLDYGYAYAFLIPASVLFAGGVIVFFGLVVSPKEVEPDENQSDVPVSDEGSDTEPLFNDIDESVNDDNEEEDTNLRTLIAKRNRNDERNKAIGFFQAFLLPGVIVYSLSYACLKLVNYAYFFWLPFYLHNKFGWKPQVADELSIWYDVGGIAGGIVGGFISDRLGHRSPVVVIMLLLSFPPIVVYSKAPADKVVNSIIMGVTGFFLGGPANLISSAISADMGRQENIKENKEALATVTGIVDGTGSVGAAIGQFLVPVIQLHLNWQWVFYFFLLMLFLSALCIVKIFITETRELIRRFRLRRRRPNHLLIQEPDEVTDER